MTEPQPTTPEPTDDPGHLLPDAIWAKVVADVAKRARRRSVTRASATVDYGQITKTIPAYAHGGVLPRVTLIVVHDAETPLQAGYADSIATRWFGTPAAGTSAHAIADPVDLIEMLPDNVTAWHVGPNANGFTLGIEQAGYARLTRADWTAPDALVQIKRVGAWVRGKALAHGIPLRWATDDQIRAAAHGVAGGVCRHADIARVLGGTTHTDPTPNYPYDLLQQAWGTPEDDMPTAAEVWGYKIDRGVSDLTGAAQPATLVLGDIFNHVRGLVALVAHLATTSGQVDVNALAAALAPLLIAGLQSQGSLSEADLETALRNVLGSLDNKS